MMINLKNIPLFNVAFNIFASLTLRLGSLFVTSVLVKGIGQAEFGHYMYIITTALMLSTISTMATGQAYIRDVSKKNLYKHSFPQYIANLFTLFIIFSIAFFIYSWCVSNNLSIIENWGVITIIAFLEVLNLALTSLFSGKEAFNKIFKARLIFAILLSFLVYCSTYFNYYMSVYPYIIAITCANLYLFIQSEVRFKLSRYKLFDIKKLSFFYQKYARLSFPIFLSGLMVTPVQWYLSNQIVLNNGFSELGLFNISMQFRMVILMVTNSVATALLPRLIKIDNDADFQKMKITGYFFSAGMCLLMILVLIFIMPYVFNFYEIETSSNILMASFLLLATALPLCLYNLHTQVLIAKGNTRTLLLFNSFWGVLVIALYNHIEVINNLSIAKILCISYFSLIVFVLIFNLFQKHTNKHLVHD